MKFQFIHKRKTLLAFLFFVFLLLLFLLGNRADLFQSEPRRNLGENKPGEVTLGCIFQGELDKNESLYLSLLRKKVPRPLIHRLTLTLSSSFDLKKSLPKDSYTLITTQDSILFFEYQKGMEEKCEVKGQNGKLKAFVVPLEFNRIVKSTKGKIESSLWESMINECESPELILKFTEIFEWDIDFLTEPRKGDSFRLIFEEYHKDGKFVKYGNILAAEYHPAFGGTHQAVLYQDLTGHKDYYDLSGKSLKKAFLKSPLNYRRISSRFSYSRFHPIFKRRQPHLGVDYAAPVGTPVVASGDGVVVYAGWKRGFGKLVQIKHPNGFVTSYGHLSRFARRIKRGVKVQQKDLIGYVGSTGCSTGPHLDYRVKANGRYVNPLRMIVPSAKPVQKQCFADFQRRRDNLLYAMNLLTNIEVLVLAEREL
ncbi:MAG: M23 family metallopeptidase [candidate division Zixibacteria bacterium]|nr:M23 family metallopeptidase [candidate division Zixibacteria bacterium]